LAKAYAVVSLSAQTGDLSGGPLDHRATRGPVNGSDPHSVVVGGVVAMLGFPIHSHRVAGRSKKEKQHKLRGSNPACRARTALLRKIIITSLLPPWRWFTAHILRLDGTAPAKSTPNLNSLFGMPAAQAGGVYVKRGRSWYIPSEILSFVEAIKENPPTL